MDFFCFILHGGNKPFGLDSKQNGFFCFVLPAGDALFGVNTASKMRCKKMAASAARAKALYWTCQQYTHVEHVDKDRKDRHESNTEVDVSQELQAGKRSNS